jgi:hypothetical protein
MVKGLVGDRKELFVIILILLLAAGLRFVPYQKETFYGFDPYVHYSIVDQSLKSGELPLANNLDICPRGVTSNHPIGFYSLPFILGKFINLKLAFSISSVLFGVLTIFLVYLLFKQVFNKKTAIFGSLFLTVCFAHIARSHANYYRGENFMVPLLLLSLYFCLNFLTGDKKLVYALLAGVTSAATALFWPGYAYALVVYAASINLYFVYQFIKGAKIGKASNFAILSLLVQFIFVKIIGWLFQLPRSEFVSKYYLLYLIIPSILLITILKYSKKYLKTLTQRAILIGSFALVGAIFAVFQRTALLDLLTGFGLISPDLLFYQAILELQPMNWNIILVHLGIIPLFSLLGLFVLLLRHDSKKMFLMGSIIPSIYLLTTTQRFVFLASVIFIPLAGVFFGALKFKKKTVYSSLFIILLVTGIASLIVVGVGDSHANNSVVSTSSPELIKTLKYFKENTEPGSCLVTSPDWGGMIQFYAERPSYSSSVYQDLDRFNELTAFLFSDQPPNFATKQGYVGLMPGDFGKIQSFITLSENDEFYAEHLVFVNSLNVHENLYTSQNGVNYVFSNQNGFSAKRMIDGQETYIRTFFVEHEGRVITSINEGAQDKGCIFVSESFAQYFNEPFCKTNFVKMIARQQIQGLEPWYVEDAARIYSLS